MRGAIVPDINVVPCLDLRNEAEQVIDEQERCN